MKALGVVVLCPDRGKLAAISSAEVAIISLPSLASITDTCARVLFL